MKHLTRVKAAAAALLTLTGLLVTSPAQAAPRDALRGNWLHLTVTRGLAAAGPAQSALLLCDPPLGHPHAVRACAQLAAAHGDIARIPYAQGVFCPMIYAPVTARAQGRWHGRPVAFRETYSSKCVMRARTGEVFALDR
ncbi:SSI family serine proteinase inhibitor [Streptomyces sp. IBSBF 3136]|uniref:SSI family serine proteinase inhibitor n=1 Tax=Streptomyces sp. IBSBF 3136 TaxID=2903524 RepID=UPI002FDC4037